MSELRGWLAGLDDDQLGRLLQIPTNLPVAAGIRTQGRAPGSGWRRRELRAARTHLATLPLAGLRLITRQAGGYAAHLLAHGHDCQEQDALSPGPEQLRQMLTDLEPLLARAYLHALADLDPSVLGPHGEQLPELAACADAPGVPVRCSCGGTSPEPSDPSCPTSESESHDQVKNQPATAAELSLSAAELRETASGLAAVLRATAELLRGMELNMLARARRDGHVRLTLPQSARLAVLLDARNCLSHREPLRTEPLARLYEHLSS
ncbi:hypothetical protein ACFV0O_01285 [Kitasatospora sp. NPDC059577]|uniref:hypothetical protein n=1 Tax=Kitasatospora sp. NPDC059577 TaxID=3346873 RepID=UPI00369D80EF